MNSARRLISLLAGLTGFAAVGLAGTITLTIPGPGGRTGSLTDAVSGFHDNSINYQASDLTNLFGGTWVMEGELEPSDGTTGVSSDGYLSVNLTTGAWGGQNVGGTWAIDSAFWANWGKAVITIHVGQGQGDPDAFAWLVTPGQTSGTWSYFDHDNKGGGLSNIKLWGSDQPTRVPDAGTTVVLIGLGIVALAFAARRSKAA